MRSRINAIVQPRQAHNQHRESAQNDPACFPQEDEVEEVDENGMLEEKKKKKKKRKARKVTKVKAPKLLRHKRKKQITLYGMGLSHLSDKTTATGRKVCIWPSPFHVCVSREHVCVSRIHVQVSASCSWP